MLDPETAKNSFAIVGIISVSALIVIKTFSLYDKIQLWGFQKGLQKWLAG